MAVYEYPPHPLLAPYIRSFCSSERLFAGAHTSFDILPDSMVEFVWSLGAPCALVLSDGTYPLPAQYVVGLLAAPLRIVATGLVRAVRVRFYPWGVFPLIGPLLRPAGLPQAPGLLWVATDGGLPEQPGSPESALHQLQQWLLERVVAATLDDGEAVQAAHTLMAHHGDLSIPLLAQRLGLSERSLRRKFHAAMQTGPKAFARLARFEQVCMTLWQTPDAALAEVALQAGYSDQAHMQREFRAFSKRTPRQFAQEMDALRRLLVAPPGRNMQDS